MLNAGAMRPSAAGVSKSSRRVLLAALAFGALASVLVVVFLARQSAAEPLPVPTLPVVVAQQEIPAGELITANMVRLASIPESAMVAGAADALPQVVGRVSRYPITKGEQVSPTQLVQSESGKALSFHIPDGMRGVTLPMEVRRSPVTVTVPGDFVDVLASSKVTGLTFTLVQNVQVLAVKQAYVSNGGAYDGTVRGDPAEIDEKANFITLAVTPDQAQQLHGALALKEYQVSVVLRPFGDASAPTLYPTAPLPTSAHFLDPLGDLDQIIGSLSGS
jgi:pilus assembly protein CpaB